MLILCRSKPIQSGHINSSLSHVRKNSTVPDITSPSCLLTAFLAALCPSGCSLSPETGKVDSLKSFLKQSPRTVRVAAIFSACCELSTETNFKKKSTVTHVNFTLRFVNGNLSRSAWPATCVFLLWCASEAASCPRNQTLNEDINFGLHVNAP